MSKLAQTGLHAESNYKFLPLPISILSKSIPRVNLVHVLCMCLWQLLCILL